MFKELLEQFKKGEVVLEKREKHPAGDFEAKLIGVKIHESQKKDRMLNCSLKTEHGLLSTFINLDSNFGKEMNEVGIHNVLLQCLKLGILTLEIDGEAIQELKTIKETQQYILDNFKTQSDYTLNIKVSYRENSDYPNVKVV